MAARQPIDLDSLTIGELEEVLAEGHTLESLCTDDIRPVSRRPGEDRKR